MSFIERKDENHDGKILGIDEAFDIIEAARIEYGVGSDEAHNIAASVRCFRDGVASSIDMEELLLLRRDLKSGTLSGRQNKAILAIDRLEKM